jgi:mannosyltransferase OCH1-like enzyme
MRISLKISVVLWAIALVTLLGYLISRLLFFKSIFFEHAGIRLTQPQVATAASNNTNIQPVPKIVHHVFHNWREPGNDELPSEWATIRKECQDLNPGFEFRVRVDRHPRHSRLLPADAPFLQLWTEKASRDFIETEYPWFLNAYDGYRYPVQRVDAVRYFLMLHYGGIYMDLDNVGGSIGNASLSCVRF